jgi:hypothetical protein
MECGIWSAAAANEDGGQVSQRFGKIVGDVTKLRDYCLSDTHPRGRHKARVFRSALGLTAGDANWLHKVLLDAARDRQDELSEAGGDEFGRRYVLDFELTTSAGTATVRSAWIVLAGHDVLRLASCYVL